MTLLEISVIVLVAAAIGGMGVTLLRMLDKKLPLVLGIGHGAAGLLGVALLVWALLEGASNFGWIGLIVLVAGAILGFSVFSFHAGKRILPMWLIFIHAVTVSMGLAVLLIGVATAWV